MKNLFRLTVLAVATMVMTSLNAKNNIPLPSSKNSFNPFYVQSVEYKILHQGLQVVPEDSLQLLQINYPLISKNLLHDFSNVKSVSYLKKGDLLCISFISNNDKILTTYYLSGQLNYSIANVGLRLPALITEQLQKQYPSYSVFYGKNIRMNNKDIYQVVIENTNEYRVINLWDTEIEEIKSLKK